MICFRFKSEKEADTLVFPGESIAVGVFKQMVDEKKTRRFRRQEGEGGQLQEKDRLRLLRV